VVCLEAMASERPVVATHVDGIPDAVGDGETGLLVPRDDPQALARAIGRLLADPAARTRFGAAGQKRARDHFAWPRIAEGYIRLFETVCDRTASAARRA